MAYEYFGESGADEETKVNAEHALNEIEGFLRQERSSNEIRRFVQEQLAGSNLSADDPRPVRQLRPFEGHFKGNEFAKLRHAFDDGEQEETEEEAHTASLPVDWPWKEKLASSSLLVIGGDSRPAAENRLEEAFEPNRFDWVNVQEKKHVRTVESWCKRIEQGTVDIVVLLVDFVSHSVSDIVVEAVKNSPGAELVFVNRGYGVEQIRHGIEGFVKLDEELV